MDMAHKYLFYYGSESGFKIRSDPDSFFRNKVESGADLNIKIQIPKKIKKNSLNLDRPKSK